MHNLFFKIAKKNLKNHRRRTTYLFISLLVVTFLYTTVMTFVDSTIKQNTLNHQERLGSYYYAVIDCTDEQKKTLEENPYLKPLSKTHCYGTFMKSNIGYIEDICLLPMSLDQGNWPQKENEIVMKKDFLISLGYPLDIGETISLDYQRLDGTNQHQDYILSGILNSDAYVIDGDLDAITMSTNDPATTNLYYISKDGPLVEGDNIFFNVNAIPDILSDRYESFYQRNTMLDSLTLIGSIIIMLSLNNIASEIEDELALLRGVGASKSQIVILIFYQIGLVACVAIPLGFELGVTTIGFLCRWMSSAFSLRMESTLIMLVSIILMLFIGTILPAIKASTASLTGHLKHKKLELKRIHFQKQTPFSLARRHMHFQRWQNILFVLVLAGLLTYLSDKILRLHHTISSPEYQQQTTYTNPFYYKTLNMNGVKEWAEAMKKIVGIDEMMTLYSSDITFNLTDQNNSIQTAQLFVLDIDEDKLSSLDEQIDSDAFISGENGLLAFEEWDPVNNFLSESYIEIPTTQFETLDSIKPDQWSDHKRTVSSLFSLIESHMSPYVLIVSSEYAKENDVLFTDASFRIKLKSNVDANDTFSGINYLLRQYDVALSYWTSPPLDASVLFSDQLKLAIYSMTAIIAMMLLIYQRISTQLKQRTRDLGIFQAIGMEKIKVVRMITYEGFILGIRVFITMTILKFLPFIINYMNSDHEYGHASLRETFLSLSKEELVIFFMTSIINFIVLTIAYYLPAKRTVSGRLIDKIRYKE